MDTPFSITNRQSHNNSSLRARATIWTQDIAPYVFPERRILFAPTLACLAALPRFLGLHPISICEIATLATYAPVGSSSSPPPSVPPSATLRIGDKMHCCHERHLTSDLPTDHSESARSGVDRFRRDFLRHLRRQHHIVTSSVSLLDHLLAVSCCDVLKRRGKVVTWQPSLGRKQQWQQPHQQ